MNSTSLLYYHSNIAGSSFSHGCDILKLTPQPTWMRESFSNELAAVATAILNLKPPTQSNISELNELDDSADVYGAQHLEYEAV